MDHERHESETRNERNGTRKARKEGGFGPRKARNGTRKARKEGADWNEALRVRQTLRVLTSIPSPMVNLFRLVRRTYAVRCTSC